MICPKCGKEISFNLCEHTAFLSPAELEAVEEMAEIIYGLGRDFPSYRARLEKYKSLGPVLAAMMKKIKENKP